MKLREMLLQELNREAATTRRVLENVPEGKPDWKPHERSMPLGSLSLLVATILSWVDHVVNRDELDIAPRDAPPQKPPEIKSRDDLLQLFDQGVDRARLALQNTTDEHLMQPWRFLAGGRLLTDEPRHGMLRGNIFNHLVHHRGQLTVYIRMNGEKVPSIYGPSADEQV